MNIDIVLMNNMLPCEHRQTSKNNKNKNKNKNNNTKICSYDFFSVNEIEICEIIKKIPYYYCDFSIIKKRDFIIIGEINEASSTILPNKNEFNEFNENNDKLVDKKATHLLIQYNKQKGINFVDFLFLFNKPKTFIFHLLNSYSALLNILLKLNDNKICFFDLSSKNIYFKADNYQPFLQNFNKSIILSKLDESYIAKIITKLKDYACKPLEIYVLFYLIRNNEETLSYHYIETIVTFYINNMGVLTFFSDTFKENYKQECMDVLKKYINQSKEKIINDILKYHEYWDTYSISIIYLHIVGSIIHVFSLQDTFMNYFLHLLSKNISPNPLKRESLKTSYKAYNALFEANNWDFVNNLDVAKMKELLKVF